MMAFQILYNNNFQIMWSRDAPFVLLALDGKVHSLDPRIWTESEEKASTWVKNGRLLDILKACKESYYRRIGPLSSETLSCPTVGDTNARRARIRPSSSRTI
jgi:hypothetical protein